jgi:hypothetical protein
MHADATESFLDENLLTNKCDAYLVEYMQAMEDDLALESRFPDTPEMGSTSLWPEALYPGMYGKILDKAQTDQAIRFQSAQKLNLSAPCVAPCVAPCAVGMDYLQTQTTASADMTQAPQLCFSTAATWSELLKTPSVTPPERTSTGLDHLSYKPRRRDSLASSEYAVFSGAGLDILDAFSTAGGSLHLEDAHWMNFRSVRKGTEYLDMKPGRKSDVPGRRANYKQRRDRVSKLRAEDEIAALLRNKYSKDRWRVHAQDKTTLRIQRRRE